MFSEFSEFANFMKGCMRDVFKKLNRISQRLEVMELKIQEKETTEHSQKILEGNILPIKTEEELTEIENKLEDEIFYRQMVMYNSIV